MAATAAGARKWVPRELFPERSPKTLDVVNISS